MRSMLRSLSFTALVVLASSSLQAQIREAPTTAWYLDWSSPSQAINRDDDPHGILAIVPAKDLGFPTGMDHVLRVTHPRTGPVYGHVVSPALWPDPQVGETRYFRVYFASWVADDEPDSVSQFTSHHPMEDTRFNGNSSQNWEIETAPHTSADGHAGFMAFVFGMLRTPEGEDMPGRRLRPGPDPDREYARLRKFLAYRIEWSFTKSGPNRYRLDDFRIYDPRHPEVPAYNKWSMYDDNDVPLARHTDDRVMVDSLISHFWLGTNGGSNYFGLRRDEYDYWGGLCVRSDTWCGAYVPGEAGR